MISVVLRRSTMSEWRGSGAAAWKVSLPWVEGAWLLGAAWSELLPPLGLGLACSWPAPRPGVMGPSTSVSGLGAWGVGASGTGACCWACATGLRFRLKLRSAASAIAVKPSFTGGSPVVSGPWLVIRDQGSATRYDRTRKNGQSAVFRASNTALVRLSDAPAACRLPASRERVQVCFLRSEISV